MNNPLKQDVDSSPEKEVCDPEHRKPLSSFKSYEIDMKLDQLFDIRTTLN